MKISLSKRGRSTHRRSGALLVETAFVLGTLLLVVFALLDLGLAALHYNSLAEAARRVNREAVVRGSKAPPKRTAWGPATLNAAGNDGSEPATIAAKSLTMGDLQNVQIQVEWPDGSDDVDARVRVTVSYTYQPIVPLLMGTSPRNLTATSEMRIAH